MFAGALYIPFLIAMIQSTIPTFSSLSPVLLQPEKHSHMLDQLKSEKERDKDEKETIWMIRGIEVKSPEDSTDNF